jgi:hypothetical protein
MRVAVVVLLLCLVAFAASQDCTKYCYADTLTFPGNATASYQLHYIPCTNSVDGQIEQSFFTSFSCTDVEAGSVLLTFETSTELVPYYRLSWLYNSGPVTCSSQSLFLGSIGTFVNFTAEYNSIGQQLVAIGPQNSLETAQAVCGADTAEHCFTFTVMLNGTAGESSACGAVNTTTCQATVTFTIIPSSGEISNFNVVVGDDVSLEAFAPDALESPELSCLSNGVLQFQSVGVYALWGETGQPCDVLMNSLQSFATGEVVAAFLVIAGEEWETSAAQGEATALVNSVCDSVHSEFANTYYVFPAWHAVQPKVACSVQLHTNQCCTVFGWKNGNFYPVYIPVLENKNYFTPEPINRGQLNFFAANTTVVEAFAVLWECHIYTLNVLTWTLKHSGSIKAHDFTPAEVDGGMLTAIDTQRTFMRQARAVRIRDDCSGAQISQWCTELLK